MSPLRLLRALHRGIVQRGGRIVTNTRVCRVVAEGEGFAIDAGAATFSCRKLVLAAGLANRRLGPMVSMPVDVAPLKGQILVTARMRPRLNHPTTHVRQTTDGHLLLGDSKEDVGYDVSSAVPVMGTIAERAVRAFPFLSAVSVVRAWAALRIMTPDGAPIYEQSLQHPGAFAANCHSGVTLAAQHARVLPKLIMDGTLGSTLGAFSQRRFNDATT